MYKLAIFDFDGTLVDSAPGIVEVMKEVVEEYNFSHETLELWSHLIGVPLKRQTQILFPDHPDEFHEEVTNRYRDIYDTKALEICPLFPGLEEMLQELSKAEIIITIASSKRRHLIDYVLEHHSLTHYFKMVVGAAEVTRHKPDPESVHITMEKLGIGPEHTVVIGDSSFDLEMARAAGVDAIGVTTGIHTREHLSKSEPAFIVSGLNEVKELILAGKVKKVPNQN